MFPLLLASINCSLSDERYIIDCPFLLPTNKRFSQILVDNAREVEAQQLGRTDVFSRVASINKFDSCVFSGIYN